jgi:5-methylcytosine-specific restriction enzyme A
MSNSTGKMYVEAHHVIPMEYQDNYEFSLDVPENIVALCPNCHRKIHMAHASEIKNMLNKLFIMRETDLQSRGIAISLENLAKMHN